VLPFWFFPADKENISNSIRISSALKNSQYIQNKLMLNDEILMRSTLKWYGCFGVQSFINHKFLVYLEEKYKITNMINSVKTRDDRCCLERIFGCIFFTEYHKISNIKSLLGNIFNYQKFGYSFENYENDIKKGKVPKEIVKVWTGR
jgi:hypothetical protein